MRVADLLQNVISSIILRNVRICQRVERPGRKPFWFLRRICSIFRRARFRRSLLQIVAVIGRNEIPR